jgi:uncharacterized protein (DUF2252 family)
MDVFQRVLTYNEGRDPERLQMKLAAMQRNPFTFLRGACHLFYEDWHTQLNALKSPNAWICGDLHLENFGTYKAENGLAYFDLNDFDESALAPCLWELSRLLTSLLVAADTLKLKPKQTEVLLDSMIHRYANALAMGKPKWVERKTAKGMIRTLLSSLSKRTQQDFLASRTITKGGLTHLIIDKERTLKLDKAQKQAALDRFKSCMEVTSKKDYFYPLDIARRIAGTGSLGVERYAVLVNGEGKGNFALIDMKATQVSALSPYLVVPQPTWNSESERVAAIQSGAQILPPALLKPVNDKGQSFLMKALQPSQDRLDLTLWDGRLNMLDNVFDTMAEISAWGHLRNAGYHDADSREALMQFGMQVAQWKDATLTLAKEAATQTVEQWKAFKAEYALTSVKK